MAKVSPARRAALGLVSRRRRSDGRIRDMAREDKKLAALSPADRALAFRLAMGATAAAAQLDELIDARLKRPSSLEPRVRDALQIATFELCHLDTPTGVTVSQGVELVRGVSPRAAGLANAVLRRMANGAREQVRGARERLATGECNVADLSLVSGLPSWLAGRVLADRGAAFASSLCGAQLEPPPVYVAANGRHCDATELEARLQSAGLEPERVEAIPGCFLLGRPAGLSGSGMVERVELVVADVAAQVVCRLAAPLAPGELLEIGQGRATKSVLLAAGIDAIHPTKIVGVESVPYKVRIARRRMEEAGLSDVVQCVEFDGTRLADDDLPPELNGLFATVLLDAPCSGTGTMRRHPEIASSLGPSDVQSLATLQLRLLRAASARVAAGGTLVYATCSVLREEDEDVVRAFLATPEGADFHVRDVVEAPCCQASEDLADLVASQRTEDGFFLSVPATGGGDGHFCACLVRD